MITNRLKSLFGLLVLLFITSCSSLDSVESKYYVVNTVSYAVKSINLSSTYVNIDMEQMNNKPYVIKADVRPAEAKDKTLIYASDNESVLSVNDKGEVTFRNKGYATVTVISKSNPSVSAEMTFNVYNGSELPDNGNDGTIRSITLENSPYMTVNLNDNKAYRVIAKVPNDSTKKVKHISTNKNVVLVDEETGNLSALKEGDAYIISYAENNPSVHAITYVVVYKESTSVPSDVEKIDLDKNPFSLIAKYNIEKYYIEGDEKYTIPDNGSELRVNINLALPIVEILMYTKIDNQTVSLIRKEDVGKYGSIPEIFAAIGAEITGDYSLRFTIDSADYPQFVQAGVIKESEVLIMEMTKYEDMEALAGLGDDIVFDPDNNNPTDPEEPEVPVEPENPYVPVEEIKVYPGEFIPYVKSETFRVRAVFVPENADNKTVRWVSSNEDIATVSEDGLVTILQNGKVTITAMGADNVNGEMTINPATEVTDFVLVEDVKDLVIGEDTGFQIETIIYPYILSNDAVKNVEYTTNSNLISVNNSGYVTLTGKTPGTAIVSVKIGSKIRDCLVRITEPSDVYVKVDSISLDETSGSYSPQQGTFRINTIFHPADATNKRLQFTSSNTSVATVSSTGVVTIHAKGKADITVKSLDNKNATAVYKLTVETLPSRIVFEAFEYGVGLNQKTTIKPIFEGDSTANKSVKYTSSNPDIASVNASTGEVTGKKIGTVTITAVSTVNKNLTSSYSLSVYTPLNMANIKSLEGTYDIVNFNQANGHLNVGTNQYGGVERMIGELTIKVSGNTVKMVSKIQMDSSRMNTFGGILGQGIKEAREGQFQVTNFIDLQYGANGFGGTGTSDRAYVSMDNGMLKTNQSFKVSVATVNVNTWYRKKSDTVKTLNKDNFYWSKNGADGLTSANAVQYFPNVKPPVKEPYYTYGLIK